MSELPNRYKKYWVPFETRGVLYHLTTADSYQQILQHGYLEPKDPAPRHWAGMQAIFMADPADPLYEKTLPDVLAHVRDKHHQLVRLHIRTSNKLLKSIDSVRTFQVALLVPIPAKEIISAETIT